MAVDELSLTFAALADPTRRAILARLAEGEATVNELAEPFPITVQAVSKHLKVLERAGLIERSRSAQLRPAPLRSDRLEDAVAWLDAYRRFWQGSFDRLDERLPDDWRNHDQTRLRCFAGGGLARLGRAGAVRRLVRGRGRRGAALDRLDGRQ